MPIESYIILHLHKENEYLKECYFEQQPSSNKYKYNVYTNYEQNIKNINPNFIKATNLNFSVQNSNNFNPRSYFEWILSDKSKYESNKGTLIRISIKDNANNKFNKLLDLLDRNKLVDIDYVFNEYIDKIQEPKSVKRLYFDIDYSKHYEGKLYFTTIK